MRTVEDAKEAIDVGVEYLVEEHGVVAVWVDRHDLLIEHAAGLDLAQWAPVNVQPEHAHPALHCTQYALEIAACIHF